MGELVSSTLPGGYTGAITADQFNRLRDDLMKHHDHSSGKGGTVAHSNTTDAVIDDTYLDHDTINKHIQGSGTSGSPDNPGGSQGVHNLSSATYLAGITKQQMICQVGTGTTDRHDSETKEQRGRGTWSTAFAEPPTLILCLNTVGQAATTTIYQRLTTSFAVKFRFRDESSYSDGNQHNIPFVWMAWGVIEE